LNFVSDGQEPADTWRHPTTNHSALYRTEFGRTQGLYGEVRSAKCDARSKQVANCRYRNSQLPITAFKAKANLAKVRVE
jgi:hypothetical protein